jgi:hypothetical protein
MKPTLYLETMIPGYLAARASRDPLTLGHGLVSSTNSLLTKPTGTPQKLTEKTHAKFIPNPSEAAADSRVPPTWGYFP